MNDIEELIKNINIYDKNNLLSQVTRKLWGMFGNQELQEKQRSSLFCCSWLFFFAVMSDNDQKSDNTQKLKNIGEITEDEMASLETSMFEILSLQSADEKSVKWSSGELFKSFINNQFQLAIKNFNDNKKQRKQANLLSRFNLDKTLSLDIIYGDLHCQEDIRLKNNELDIKYSLPIVRSLLIIEKLLEVLTNAMKNAKKKAEFEKDVQANLGVSIARFHQVFHLIFKIAFGFKGVFSEQQLHQIFQLKDERFKDEFKNLSKDELNQLEIDTNIILNKFSFNQGDIEKKYRELEEYMNTGNLTPASYHNPFYEKPIFRQDIDKEVVYFVPSPYIFQFCSGWIFLSKIPGEKYSNEIGKAVSGYLQDLLEFYKPTTNIEDIKNLDSEDKNELSRADFLIETENYCFIVECKNSLGLRNRYNKNGEPKNLENILCMWDRIFHSFRQCQSTVSRYKSDKKIFKLVVVNETVLGEASSFFALRHETAFKELGLEWGKFSILSSTQFGYLVSSGSLEEFAIVCEKNSEGLEDRNLLELNYNEIMKALNLLFALKNKPDDRFWEKEYGKLDNISCESQVSLETSC